CQQYNSLPFSF
nr:immunoglobulin light chain junction region [Macaca mulatta]MOV80075.1 immunoglobulin light chain junction region [Macaca mulatta]MOV81083.1 immunoglobulin light chain junction region [Macaca mulatta]MOV82378.1 immunoglobulin light chain junction region [Macaca mulatta]MOW09350.1 immunoglobulin light chain junction region [Macaca mulatta]